MNRELSSPIARDFVLNLEKVCSESLTETEALLNLLAAAQALQNKSLADFSKQQLVNLQVPENQIQEVSEIVALVSMLNTYYKFQSALTKELFERDYPRTGLRMQGLTQLINSKETYEQLAFTVSVVNSCGLCIQSHEQKLKDLGVSKEKIHSLVRVASVSQGLTVFLSI